MLPPGLERPQRLDHVAYLTRDMARTVRWYEQMLGLRLVGHVQNERVPSTGEDYPHFHAFLELGDGSSVAFFEVDNLPDQPDVTVVPRWVRHLALHVPSAEALQGFKAHLESQGVEVLGPVDHGFCHSIYFFDPNDIRLELTHVLAPPGAADAEAAQAALATWRVRR